MLDGSPAGTEALFGRFKLTGDPTIHVTAQKTREITSLNLASMGRRLDERTARQFLLGAVILEFAVILLIVTNAAASTVTREKEDGSLDLLLTTPITSRYYIWGKLRGLVSFVLPLVAVPVLSAAMFIAYDSFRLLREGDIGFRWIVFPEAILIMPGTLIIVAAFASILGMQMSLRCRTTVRAVMSSVGIMLGACAALGWCGTAFLSQRGSNPVTLALANFSPFTVLMLLIDPWTWAGSSFSASNPQDVQGNRIVIFVVSWIATGAYAMLVWSMYKSMVKNFDMTIRRQSR
jgi:ABC-type Na+ efflux pump permease subunit